MKHGISKRNETFHFLDVQNIKQKKKTAFRCCRCLKFAKIIHMSGAKNIFYTINDLWYVWVDGYSLLHITHKHSIVANNIRNDKSWQTIWCLCFDDRNVILVPYSLVAISPPPIIGLFIKLKLAPLPLLNPWNTDSTVYILVQFNTTKKRWNQKSSDLFFEQKSPI